MMAAFTMNEVQCAWVRQLLFEEMHEAASTLADQALGAAEGNVADDNLDGDDALGTWRTRMQVVAGLLDTIGWSVRQDTALIVEHDRAAR